MIYIQKQLRFYETEEFLPLSYKVGETMQDYEDGAYLLLDVEQEAFISEHPDATPIEVWNKEMTPVSEQPETPDPEQNLLDIARMTKLREIKEQDELSNKFYVSVIKDGREIVNYGLWLDKDLRNSLYSITLPALKKDGKTMTKLWTEGVPPQSIEVPIDWAMEKLPLLEIYAKRTYDIRLSNEAAVYAAATVEEIAQIDIKSGYPHFLTFELNLDLRI